MAPQANVLSKLHYKGKLFRHHIRGTCKSWRVAARGRRRTSSEGCTYDSSCSPRIPGSCASRKSTQASYSLSEGENGLAGLVSGLLESLESLADASARSLLSTVHLFGVRDEGLEVGNHGFELAGNGGHEDTCASLRP